MGVLSSNGFSSFALFSPFHLLGSLMGADLTTGAGTSAGKDAPPPPPRPRACSRLLTHTPTHSLSHTHTQINGTHSPAQGHKIHD